MNKRSVDLLARVYAAALVATLSTRRTFLARKGPLGLLAEFLPYLPLPLPAALGWSLGGRRIGTLALLSVGAIGYARTYAHRFMRKQRQARRPPELHVLLSNVRRETDNALRVADLVIRRGADCVALLELEPDYYRKILPLLEAAYPHHVAHASEGYKGVGWWSRFPLREVDVAWLPTGEPLALAVEASLPSMRVRLVAAHPIVPDVGWEATHFWTFEADARDADVKQVLALVDRLEPPVVVAADLNLTDQSAAYADIVRLLRDAFDEVGRGFGHTFPLRFPLLEPRPRWRWPLLRIDYLLCTPDLVATGCRVLPSVGSDHLPIEARFNLPRAD
jgi:endonuclease/exonuclease/phosphatase (EEP) superfamily protein YafD